MNEEALEHELVKLESKQVTVVRPSYGNQSDSWRAWIHICRGDHYPHKFEVLWDSGSTSTVFMASDVVSLTLDSKPFPIIRLKGPEDYVHKMETIGK